MYAGGGANRHHFNKLIWKIASPKWNFDATPTVIDRP
jgi:hypothetical protein